eukprot:357210-Chlamydomonas_euryale.AAC.3
MHPAVLESGKARWQRALMLLSRGRDWRAGWVRGLWFCGRAPVARPAAPHKADMAGGRRRRHRGRPTRPGCARIFCECCRPHARAPSVRATAPRSAAGARVSCCRRTCIACSEWKRPLARIFYRTGLGPRLGQSKYNQAVKMQTASQGKDLRQGCRKAHKFCKAP